MDLASGQQLYHQFHDRTDNVTVVFPLANFYFLWGFQLLPLSSNKEEGV
jgi:uncharacterized membrane protein